jgi:cytochrome c556
VRHYRRAAWAGALLTVVLGAGAAWAMTGAEAVQARRSVFGQMTGALRYIVNHWDDSQRYGDVARAAAFIQRAADGLPKLFPAGTGQGDGFRTAASDAIWTDRTGFEGLARQLASQSGKLATTTTTTDTAKVRHEIEVVIATCKSCHRDYRN